MDVAINVATDVSPEFFDRIRYTLSLIASVGQFITIPLLLLRAYAIWGENKALLPILFDLWITPMAIGIYACTTYFGVPNFTFIPMDIIGGCSAEPHDGLIAAAPFIANLIVDSLVLFLTLGGLIHMKGSLQTSFVRRLLIRDGILYYVVVVFINIINLIFFLSPGIPESIPRAIFAGPATISVTIMIGRLYIVVVVLNIINFIFFLAPDIPENIPRAIFAGPASISVTIMVGRLFFNLQNIFLSHNGEVANGSDGSRGSSSRNRRSFNASGNSAPMYPMQPIQVAYAVDTTERVDDVESVGVNQLERGASSDTKKRPVEDYV